MNDSIKFDNSLVDENNEKNTLVLDFKSANRILLDQIETHTFILKNGTYKNGIELNQMELNDVEYSYNLNKHRYETITNFSKKPYNIKVKVLNNDTGEVNNFLIGDYDEKFHDYKVDSKFSYIFRKIMQNKFDDNEELLNHQKLTYENEEIINVNDIVKKEHVGKEVSIEEEVELARENKWIYNTLSQEQVELIFGYDNQNLLIQGVPGSGKSIIGYERLARLDYDDNSKKKYLLLFPNERIKNYLDKEFGSNRSSQFITDDINQSMRKVLKNYEFNVSRYKDFRDYFTTYFESFFITKDEINIATVLKKNDESFFDLFNGKSDENIHLFSNIYNRLLIILKKIQFFENNSKTLLNYINKDLSKLYKSINNIVDQTSLKVELDDDKKKLLFVNSITYGIGNTRKEDFIKKYFGLSLSEYNSREDIKDLVFDFLFKKDNLRYVKYKELVADSLKYLQDANDYFVDYLLKEIKDINEYQQSIEHVYVDEAQDLSFFELKLLKTIYKHSTFTLTGDINQSNGKDFTQDNWDLIVKLFNANVVNINTTYRSKKSIVENFNRYMEKDTYFDATSYSEENGYFGEFEDINEHILEDLESLKSDFVLMYFNYQDALKLEKVLKKHRINVTKMYNVYETKGMEFKNIILLGNDFDESINSNKFKYTTYSRAIDMLVHLNSIDSIK